jgi:hypothetical protein
MCAAASVVGVADLYFPWLGISFAKACGFAGTFTEEEQFGAAYASVSFDFDGCDLGGIGREGSFDAFTLNDASDSEHFTGP